MAEAHRFTTQGNVTLDASGNGQIEFRPAGHKWEIDSLTVTVSSRTLEARARVYAGYVGDNYYLDGTYSGSSGDTSDTRHYLHDGEALIVRWEGGDVGATATCVIRGWESTNQGGFLAVH